jgi:hypothetical protein
VSDVPALQPIYRDPRVVAGLRTFYRGSPLPMMVAPLALLPGDCAALRSSVADLPMVTLAVADRGRYRHGDEPRAPGLVAELRELAEQTAELRLEAAGLRWLRLAHGDYALTKDDHHQARAGRPEGTHLELLLDFSATSTGEAEIVYTDGTCQLAVPQLAGSVALVERRPGIYRYQRYLTHRVGDAEVWRLQLALRPV